MKDVGGLKKFSILLYFCCVLLLAAPLLFNSGQAAANIWEPIDFEPDPLYEEYIEKYDGYPEPDVEILIPAVEYIDKDMEAEVFEDFEGTERDVLRTDEEGYIEWEVDVEEAGLYSIEMRYYPVEGRSGDIERELWINGERPFEGSSVLSFTRIWTDAREIRKDNQGNEIRPPQVELPRWRETYFKDDMGYIQRPYQFYLKEGTNTIRLASRVEPMIIDYIKLTQPEEIPFYSEVREKYEELGHSPTSGISITVQGQDAAYKSTPTLFPVHDQGDPTVTPYHPAEIRLNSIGGHQWNQPGDWVTWEVEVPESGLYKLAIKGKQDQRRGTYSNRRIYVNGKVPFMEALELHFPHSSSYRNYVLGGEEPYLVYLEEGTNEITLEAALGGLSEMIMTTEQSLYELTTLYRRIVMITSANPDPLRDYQLHERMPTLVDSLLEQAEIIEGLANDLEEYTGEKGGHISVLDDLSRQLRRMADDPFRIPRQLPAFRDNAGALGMWIMETTEQPVQVDYIVVASPDEELPRAEATVSQTLLHEVRAFAASFTHDYDMIGDVYDPAEARAMGRAEPLTVWLGTGRDQAQAIKSMIEDDFTPETGIPVNLEHVLMGVILPATLAGQGPDLAISVNPAMPINFALRNAIIDLAQFPDFADVAERFHHSAIVPFQFRDEVYAIPEQQPFPMLFYRKDILHEMGLGIPETWEDVYYIMAELQKDHMEFGLPFSRVERAATGGIGEATAGAGSISAHAGTITFLAFLYQQGGELFAEDAISSQLDNELAIDSFIKWTELYELYNVPLIFNAQNRFRMGEMPLVITGYTLYNILRVFAPELRGKWGFTTVPGTVREDGTIDRTIPPGVAGAGIAGLALTPSAGPGAMIMRRAKDKEAAWEFLKWWTSEEAQTRFGRELESLMGPAARYPTANVNALRNLPWSIDEIESLEEQWDWVKGVPEIPGGYLTGRQLDFAFRAVVYNHEDPRETLLDYNREVNEEIAHKRDEFGLETSIDELSEELRVYYWNKQPWFDD